MKVIAIVSRKGGSGKSTIAIHLAVAASMAGKETAIIDLDPQSSAAKWSDSRSAEFPVVVSAQAARLEKVLEAAEKEGADLVFIDTSPHTETAALAAIRAADFILVPCRPSIVDLRAIDDTIDLIKLAKKTSVAAAVLNGVPPQGSLGDEAVEAIAGYGIAVAPVKIGHRSAFVRSLTDGLTAIEYEPKGKAAKEINALYKWTCTQVKV